MPAPPIGPVGGYWRVHRALSNLRGRAGTYRCVDCAGRAAEWSYDFGDPAELVDPVHRWRYSTDPAHYAPRCRRCHANLDTGVARAARVRRAAAEQAAAGLALFELDTAGVTG